MPSERYLRGRQPAPGVESVVIDSVLIVTQWEDIHHFGCVVCTPTVLKRAREHLENVQAIVAASLHDSEPQGRQAPPKKQETPSPARPEVSTPAASSPVDGRAASAHSATSPRS